MPNSKINKQPLFFYHQCIRSKSLRLITVIGGYPFYQSTGRNSSSPGTFFPFGGLSPFPFYKGWFIKPKTEFSGSYLPKNLTSFMTGLSRFDFDRFGNIETILLSLLMGGGYWDTDDGKKLTRYIYTHHLKEISVLWQEHKDYFNSFKSFDNLSEIEKIDSSEIDRINQLLDENSKLLNIKEEELLDKLYKYPNLRSYSEHKFSKGISKDTLNNPDTNANLNNKFVNMAIDMCNKYLAHINTVKHGDNLSRVKRLAIQNMKRALTDNSIGSAQDRLIITKNIFTAYKPIFSKNRDSKAKLLLKNIAHVLTLGIISKLTKGSFTFWKPHSQVLAENIEPKLSDASMLGN